MTSYNAPENTKKVYAYPLDESLYRPTSEEIAFFKSLTRIDDDEDLKKHIISVQTKAYEIFPYPTIRRFIFMKLKVTQLPGYDRLISLARNRPGALLLDVGCGFGHDTRKVVIDGFPAENILGSDIHREFWDLGHELFRSTPQTFPVNFLEGDVFKTDFLADNQPVYEVNGATPLDLSTLTSLTPLHGRLSAITAIALFHVFDEEQQIQLAHRLGALLSPEPGSMILGWQVGSSVKKMETRLWAHMFCQSPDAWRDVWDGQVFKKGTVKVDIVLRHVPEAPADMELDGIFWSVTRL